MLITNVTHSVYKTKRSREKAIIYSLIMIKTDKLKTESGVDIALRVKYSICARYLSLSLSLFFSGMKNEKWKKERAEFIFLDDKFPRFPRIEQIFRRVKSLSRNENETEEQGERRRIYFFFYSFVLSSYSDL